MKERDDAVLISGDAADNNVPRISLGAFVRQNYLRNFSHRFFLDRWRDVPMDIRFRCTNQCNENCSRCFECSGPNNPLNVLPVRDAAFYQRSLNNWRGVYMTGGEWSLIYDKDCNYMLKMFNAMNLHNSDSYMIQTNCRWVFGPHCEKIFSDLCKIQSKLGAAGKFLKLDVSVDRYRSRASLDGVMELIRRIATNSKFDNTKIRIMSCRLDYQMANKVVLCPEYFESQGVHLKFQPRDFFNPFFQVCYANNVRIVIHEEGPTMRIGRAAQNGFGYKIFYPEKQCGGLTDDSLCMELSFREDGTVKWHNYYDWDIVVPYKDKNGQNKPLEQIKSELLAMAWKKRLRKNIVESVYNLIPGVNIARKIFINKQIQETFRENQQKIVYKCRDLRQL